MSARDWENPARQDPGVADPVADGRPTPGAPRPWSDEPPGSPGWDEAGNEEERRGDANREIAESQDGRRGASPREEPPEVAGSKLDVGTRDDTELGT